MRQIRMLRAMRRELETGLRCLLHGHAGGNPGHGQGAAYGLPRQFPTLPSGLEVIRTPFRAPQANGVAERSVRTVRSECLDWLLILNDQHLERVLTVFADHYNGHRPHRALALTPPRPTRRPVAPATECGEARVQRRDRLGGVVHEYVLAA